MRVNINHTVSLDSTPDTIVDLILKDRLSSSTLDLRPSTLDFITPPHPTTLSLKDFGFEQSYIDAALEHILSLHPSLGRGDHEVGRGVSNKIHPYNHSLLQLASEKRKSMTPSEVLIWSVLKNNGIGYDFHRQKVIGDYIVDYYCPDLQLVLEIDGKYHEYSVNTDAQRQQYLESLGISVIRIQNEDIRDGIDVWIKKRCDERARHLTPSTASPQAGGAVPLPVGKDKSKDASSGKLASNSETEGVRNAIVVYSDYDADGITGGAILWEAMHTLGFKVHPYIGDRIEEGYGLSNIGIDKIKEKYDPALIITVDHGISGKDQVTYAKSIGIDVIVTDHHHRSEERVPTDARAIFHIPALSGSGVAYYVAKEITTRLTNQSDVTLSLSKGQLSTINSQFMNDYLALASIGTIADLVPLTGPSRAIAKYGLQSLTKTTRPGLLALYKVAGHLGKTISPYEVGFQIAPRINASGRLDSALDALRLLCTTSATRAHELADKLNTLNQDRQDMTKRATEEAMQIVERMRNANGTLPKLLIVYQTPPSKDGSFLGEGVPSSGGTEGVVLSTPEPQAQAWHEGIIGLIASKLVEKYYRPVIVLTPTPSTASDAVPLSVGKELKDASLGKLSIRPVGGETEGVIFKASARSISGFHLADFLARHQTLLLRYGGHAAAAGLSIKSEQLEQFSHEAIADADSLITTEMLEKTLKVDVDIPLKLATIELASKLETLEPYGMSNPRPVFQSLGIIQEIRTMGKENQHLKLIIQTPSPRLLAGSFPKEAYSENPSLGRGDHEVGRGVSSLSLLAFSKAAEYAHLKTGIQVQVVYTLDINEWQGKRTQQGKVLYLQSNL